MRIPRLTGAALDRWIRRESARRGYGASASGRDAKLPSSERLDEMEAVKSENLEKKERLTGGITSLSAARDALSLARSRVEQARAFVVSANQSGTDRSALASQANGLLAQAISGLHAFSSSGQSPFIGATPQIAVNHTIGKGSFVVPLSAQREVFESDESKPVKAWTRILGSVGQENARGFTIGADGSTYLSGSTYGSLDGQPNGGNSDIFLAKYNPDGSREWTRLLGTAVEDWSNSVTMGPDGRVYVVGATRGNLEGFTNAGGEDVFVTAFNTDGSKAWTRSFGTSENDSASNLAFGGDGSIFITGYSEGNLNGEINAGRAPNPGVHGSDAFITKLNPDGAISWTRLLGTDGNESGADVAVGLDGGVYIAGHSGLGSVPLDGFVNNGVGDAFIAKYSANGVKEWTRLLGSPLPDGGSYLGIGPDGSIFLGGSTQGQSFDGQTTSGGWPRSDAFLTKFSPDGTKVWTQVKGEPGVNTGANFQMGPGGGIYHLSGNGKFTKFNPDGSQEWSGVLPLPQRPDLSLSAGQLVFGPQEEMYVYGTSSGGTLDDQSGYGITDVFLTRYTPYTVSATSVVGAYSELIVDLSTRGSTNAALSSIDSLLAAFQTSTDTIDRGKNRANRAAAYLSRIEKIQQVQSTVLTSATELPTVNSRVNQSSSERILEQASTADTYTRMKSIALSEFRQQYFATLGGRSSRRG